MLELMAQSVGIYNTCQMVSIAILSQDAVVKPKSVTKIVISNSSYVQWLNNDQTTSGDDKISRMIYQERNFFAGLTGTEFDSHWFNQDGVYFSAVGRSFYEQCFPRNSVHVGFSSYAVSYLSIRFVHSLINICVCNSNWQRLVTVT